jgi:hypothetical protein
MRILFCHGAAPGDDEREAVEALITGFLQEGHAVQVVGPAASARRRRPAWLQRLWEVAGNLPAIIRLLAACRSFRPELVYERQARQAAAVAWIARRRRLRYVVEATGAAGVLARNGVRAADCVVVGSDALAKRAIADGAVPDRLLLIRAGFSPALYLPTAFLPSAQTGGPVPVSGPAPLRIGAVCGTGGAARMISALADWSGSVPPLLTLFADGTANAGLVAEIEAAGLGERVCPVGHLDAARRAGLVMALDIVVLSSGEMWAGLFDAMAAGCAIVAPDTAVLRETLADGQTALLVDPADAGAPWAAVRRLADDAALRARLGEAARAELARGDYSWRGKARRIAGSTSAGSVV